ncbi:UDP-galactopyranose mutase [Nitrosomonas marina]|uniref:UDP-galactopyranose mutase n=1 Tax=Nitrosomonas marina TaxID=917 RepID=A0A1I0G878_9PROT|nr:NAD(P)-binding protein [Nitrosomonas marina]SET66110.1 UDP-galactopyranose mutase [Nitrosomonas marina]
MKIDIDTLIIGAGPSGLTAAYILGNAGIACSIIEKSNQVGGLMRSIRRGDFIVDIGRKELYTRLAKVNDFWEELLGSDYQPYSHREGILYHDMILESNGSWLGFRRGMSWHLLFVCGLDLIKSVCISSFSKPVNFAEYNYKRRGRLLTQIFTQGYEEKFKGIDWSKIPPHGGADYKRIYDPLAKKHNLERLETRWRHPAKGTGQICEILEQKTKANGVDFVLGATIIDITLKEEVIDEVTVDTGSKVITYKPNHVISSTPIEILGKWLKCIDTCQDPSVNLENISIKRSTICVYLFLDAPPLFPHAWLKSTCPKMKAGRIVNYASIGKGMVPANKTCLCVEYFCQGNDPLLQLDDNELSELAITECGNARIIDPAACFDSFILKLPNVNAATSWRDWENSSTIDLMSKILTIRNLYYVNRPGTDKATYAGLEAARSIIMDDRRIYYHELSETLPVTIKFPELL